MLVEEVLRNDRENSPEWLQQAHGLDHETLADFCSSRVVYYPGSGTDGSAIALFNATSSAHCFIHIDLSCSSQKVMQKLDPDHPSNINGYTPLFQTEITPNELQELLNLDMQHPVAGQEPHLKSALWTILRRNSDYSSEHGSEYLAFFHIQAEAVWACWNLWSRHAHYPYAVILQDHGFGGNYAPFGGTDAPLYRVAQQTSFPKYLLVADNTTEWLDYTPMSELSQRVGGNRNSIFQRIE